MLDEIREQRFLVCHLCIERILIVGARALHGAGMARRGNRQLRPQPGVFLPEQGNLFRLFCNGGWGAASGGRGRQIAAGGGGDFGLGIIAVSGWSAWLVGGGFERCSCCSLGPLHGATLLRDLSPDDCMARRLKAAPKLSHSSDHPRVHAKAYEH